MSESLEFFDLNPERNFANSARLGRILDVSPRQVRRLAQDGVIHREPAGPFVGQFHIRSAVEAHVALLTKQKSSATQRLDATKAKLLERQMARESRTEILLAEALDVLDLVSTALALALADIEQKAKAEKLDPAKINAVLGHAHDALSASWDRTRRRLETGNQIDGD